MEESRTPVLSVVIIGRNEGERLKGCLESIRKIRGVEGNVEIIYVDSASTDGSPQTARSFGAQVVVLQDGKRTAARGRNAGWPMALAPYVLFLDGDTILNPEFPRVALDSLTSDQSFAAVWGHRRELHPERSLYNRVADLDWIYAPGFTDYCGGDVLMRRSALAEVDGYDSDLIAGEEPELCRRLRSRGYRILHIDHPMTLHDLDLRRFSQYWKRATRAGYAYAEISNRFRTSSDKMWLQDSRKNLRMGTFWTVLLLLGIGLAAFGSWLSLLTVAFILLVAARSAWRARHKAPGKPILLLFYGIHSHMQQIPILFGQLSYYADRYLGKQRKQIEYKEGASA
jgi:glycosyltransferase involved in cell wall biosynthesis